MPASITLALILLALAAGVILWMVIEPVLHEGAHLVAGRMVGFSPYAVTIGRGALLFRRRFGSIEVRFHLIPGSGAVKLLPHMNISGWRGAAFSIAGIIVDAFLLVLLINLVDLRSPASDPGQGPFVAIFLIALVLYQAWVIAANTIPRDALVEGIKVANDGKQFLAYLRGRPSWVAQYEQSIARYDPTFRIADSWLVRSDPAAVALHNESQIDLAAGRHAEGVAKAEQVLGKVDMHPAEKAALLDGLACVAVIGGDKRFIARAEIWAREACRLFPACTTLRGTLGSVLVEASRYEEGLALLLPLTTQDNSAVDRTLAACFAAKALQACGRADEAAQMMQTAVSGGVFHEVCARVKAELAATSGREP